VAKRSGAAKARRQTPKGSGHVARGCVSDNLERGHFWVCAAVRRLRIKAIYSARRSVVLCLMWSSGRRPAEELENLEFQERFITTTENEDSANDIPYCTTKNARLDSPIRTQRRRIQARHLMVEEYERPGWTSTKLGSTSRREGRDEALKSQKHAVRSGTGLAP